MVKEMRPFKIRGKVILIGSGVFLILRVGHLGGKLVYQHGAGVNRTLLEKE